MKMRAFLTLFFIVLIFPFYLFLPSLKRDRNHYHGDENFNANRWKKAARYYEKTLQYNGHFPQVLARLGYCYLQLGDTTKAEQSLQTSLKEDSTQLKTYRWLGDLRLGKKNWPVAASHFIKLIQLYRAHHTLSREEAADYLYALDRLVFCQLQMKQDSLALRQLHDFASVLRTKVQP